MARQEEGAGHDRKRAADRDRRRVLAEDRDRADGREKGTARARDRINERQIACAIARGQRREVQRLQTPGDQDEHERRPAELGPGDDQDRDRERREHDRAGDIREPEKRRVRSGALREQIPRRVKYRGNKDQTESEETHGGKLTRRRTRGSRARSGTRGPTAKRPGRRSRSPAVAGGGAREHVSPPAAAAHGARGGDSVETGWSAS